MKILLHHWGRFAAGTTTAGLLVGFVEGVYRHVNLLYAMLLYGALWALAGLAAGPLASWMFRRRREQPLFAWAFAAAVGSSALILVRFVLWRDVFQEAPGKGLHATVGALAAALALAMLSLIIGRAVRRYLTFDNIKRPTLTLALPAGCIVLFALRATLGGADPAARPAAPNEATKIAAKKGVILLVVDTLRADVLGAYGAGQHRDHPPSPVFDSLAAEGRLFLQASAQSSWTKPAMASILTSRHAAGHNTMSKAAMLPETLPYLPEVLRQSGVQTGAVVTNYNLEEGYGFARGFDSFRYLAPARYLGAPERANRLAAYNVYRLIREKFLPGRRNPEHFYRSADDVNALGLQFIDQLDSNTFFLWLHYMEPHDPYFSIDGSSYARVSTPKPPAAWADPMLLAYKDDVRRFDAALGNLVDALKQRGIYDDVLFVITADHGEEFADHGGFYHGVTLYQEQLHIPLVLRGRAIEPEADDTLARHIDIAPTITTYLQVETPPSWEGRNLLDPSLAPEAVIAEEDHEGNVLFAIRHGDDKFILTNPENPRGLPEQELFDLQQDPKEQYAVDDASKRAHLQQALERILGHARKGGATAPERPLDAEAEAQLRALGYIE